MLVTLPGMTVLLQPDNNVLLDVSIMALQLSLESYMGLSSSTMIEVKLEQPSNVLPPKYVTSMLVTLVGILMEVKPEQKEYLQPVITQYFASNKSEIWS